LDGHDRTESHYSSGEVKSKPIRGFSHSDGKQNPG